MRLIVGPDEAAAYHDICAEIKVAPDAEVGTGQLHSLLLTGESSEVDVGCLDLRGKYNTATLPLADINGPHPLPTILTDPETGSTVVIRDDWMSGCPTCFYAKIKATQNTFQPAIDLEISDNLIQTLVLLFDQIHHLPLAVSRFHPEQNWSVFLPLADCPTCGHIQRGRKSFGDVYGALWDQSAQGDGVYAVNGNAGVRQKSAEEFVAHNRAFIGFSAVVGNFAVVENEPLAALTHAPIYLSADFNMNEVSGGKGFDLEQSLASCLGEGLERYFLAGPFREPGIVTTRKKLGAKACDPVSEFGFPTTDKHFSISEYTDDLPIEWIKADELTEGTSVLVPANLVFCPYNAPAGAHIISSGSTNGAAAGASLEDSTRQGLLEIIERDAFWFYARTRSRVVFVPQQQLPKRLQDYIDERPWASFKAQVLPSPFRDVIVAQVVMTSSLGADTKTARGTGATFSLESSLERAFSECLQMYYSLSSTLGAPPDPLDMRSLWADGSAMDTFPNFFEPRQGSLPSVRNWVSPQLALDNIIAGAREQGLKVYRYELANSPNFSIAKTFMSRLAVTDAIHFHSNCRFEQFGAIVGAPYRDIHFRGPLFM